MVQALSTNMVVLLAGERVLKVDAHTHILPDGWPDDFEIPLRLIKYDQVSEKGFAARLEYKESGKLFRELKPNCFDIDIVLEQCDASGVDIQTLCTVPVMFNYHLNPAQGVKWAQFLNDDLARVVKLRPDRLAGLGTLPLQDTAASVAEVGRCVSMGIRGFQIGSHINAFRGYKDDGTTPIVENLPLNHADLRPVLAECSRLGACLMIHPWDMEWWCTPNYWQPWLVGMPAETTLAGTALILGGVINELPQLRVMMSHGGGALAWLKGRIDWGYRCRPDLVAPDCPQMPSDMIKHLYFDSITHDEGALQMIVNMVGPKRVMLGSDYPFPLGEVPSVAPKTEEVLLAYPGQLIQEHSILTFEEKKMLLGLSALEWLGLQLDDYSHRLRDPTIKAQLVRVESTGAGSRDARTPWSKGLDPMKKPLSPDGPSPDGAPPPPTAVLEASPEPSLSPGQAHDPALGRVESSNRPRSAVSTGISSSTLEGKMEYDSVSALEYFPIHKRNRTRPFRENPLEEIGRQWEASFPSSKKLRANFPRGEVVAASGHSLSRPSLRSVTVVNEVFQKVNSSLHGIHWPDAEDKDEKDRADYAYKLHLHRPACETLGKLLGCRREDINLGNGLSDDLIRLVETHIHPEILGTRRKVLCLTTDFNSDLTIVRSFLRKTIVNALIASGALFNSEALEGHPSAKEYRRLKAIFLSPESTEKQQYEEIERSFLVQVKPEESQLYATGEILDIIAARHKEIAGALLPSIVFHTSQLLDIPSINGALVDRGIVCVWDTAHSVGNVMHHFEVDRVVAAAGCGYKHLNGLPGGPGFIYQNSQLLLELMGNNSRGDNQERPVVVPTPVSGWLSNGRTDPFDAFPVLTRFSADTLQPVTSVQRQRASNPEVLALRTLIANLQVVEESGVDAWMATMRALAECLLHALDKFFEEEIKAGIFSFITPRDESQRGATVCFVIKGVDAGRVQHAMLTDKYNLGYKFEIDLGPGAQPSFRVTAHCCHMSFMDTVNLAFCLRLCYDAEIRRS